MSCFTQHIYVIHELETIIENARHKLGKAFDLKNVNEKSLTELINEAETKYKDNK